MRRAGSAILLLSAIATWASAQQVGDSFTTRSFTGSNGLTMPYRLFVPPAAARARPLPMVVYLHGSGGAGTDNIRQVSGGNTKGTHLWIRDDVQARYRAFVVAPQAPTDQRWGEPDQDSLAPYGELVIELIQTLTREFSIDTLRLYLTGQSLGGEGVWDIIAKRPHVFAAAVPLCGRGSPTRVVAARSVAVWAFHGAKDDVIPVARSRELVAALKAAGGVVRYTEYPDVDHTVWNQAFGEPELPDWLFAQKRYLR